MASTRGRSRSNSLRQNCGMHENNVAFVSFTEGTLDVHGIDVACHTTDVAECLVLLKLHSKFPRYAPSLGWHTLRLSSVLLQKRGLRNRPVVYPHLAVSDGAVHWELASAFLDASLHHFLVASHIPHLQTHYCWPFTPIPCKVCISE